TKESAFSAEQWVARIQRAKTSGNWTDAITMSYVFSAMRGEALIWFDALPTLNFDQDNWDGFKGAFLQTYGRVKTVRTAALQLSDIKQSSSDTVASYISRVIRIVNDIKATSPANLPAPAEPWTAEVLAVGQFVALQDNVKNAQIQRLLQHGAEDAYNRLGMQLFVAGLRPALRQKLMEANPNNMREAFDAAMTAESILSEPHKLGLAKAHMAAIDDEQEGDDEDEDEVDFDEEDLDNLDISAISQKFKKLQKKLAASKKKKSPAGGKASNSKGSQAKNNGQKNNGQNGKKQGCWYCGKPNHRQGNCFARKNAGAPEVDANGQPRGGVSSISQQQQQQQMQQQFAAMMQQMHQPPPSFQQHQEQMGTGVGAIWNAPHKQDGGNNVPHYLNY
ncbi:MAG: hypothetical protein ACOYB2_19780, partial [Limnohabitans sp.]